MPLFDITKHQMICSKGDFREAYAMQQINGQLVSTFKHVPHPKRGTEVFIKKLPRDILLQDIFEFAVRCGDIFRIRLLMDFSGYNRGYCFVTYFDVKSARKAILTLNGEKINKDCCVFVKLSFDNNKLEMRGVPHGIEREEIFNVMSEIIGNGLRGVITFKKSNSVTITNRCVLKYDTHRHALEARKKVWPTIKIWRRKIEIDWAVPHEVLNQSKRLYFENAPKETTKFQLYDEITKYVEPSIMLNMFLQEGLGYLLFVSGRDAFDAYLKLRAQKICGEVLEFSFTKFYKRLHGEKITNILEEADLSDESSERTLSDNMNGTVSSDREESWDTTSSSSEDEGINTRTSSPFAGSTSTINSSIENALQPSDVLPEPSSYGLNLPVQSEPQWPIQPVQYSGNGFPVANPYIVENVANRNVVTNNFFPMMVVPNPVITVPVPYNEAAEIHQCVSQYFNFNHPTSRWMYNTTNEVVHSSTSYAPYSNMVRIMPIINHVQYDLTLVQVPRMPEYHFW